MAKQESTPWPDVCNYHRERDAYELHMAFAIRPLLHSAESSLGNSLLYHNRKSKGEVVSEKLQRAQGVRVASTINNNKYQIPHFHKHVSPDPLGLHTVQILLSNQELLGADKVDNLSLKTKLIQEKNKTELVYWD